MIKRVQSIDPSRTALLRAHFKRELLKRVKTIKLELRKLLLERDILGFKQSITFNNDWLDTKVKQVQSLLSWVRQKFKEALLGSEDKSLWERIVSEAFKRGIARSYDDSSKVMKGVSKEADIYQEGKREEFIRSTFASKAEQEKLKLLSQRVYTDIEGVNEATSVNLARSLSNGLAKGKTINQIANDLSKDITDISEARLTLIAQTEIVRAHAEGQLSALEKMGADEVGILAEWTVGKGNVCRRCESYAGRKFTLEAASGMIPLHPRCKCIWRII